MIAFDNSGTTNGNGTSARTYSFTVGNGSNRLLMATTWYIRGSGNPPPPTMTYNGVSLTRFDDFSVFSSTTYGCQMFYLSAPATGANDLVITPDPGSSITDVSSVINVVSYSGINQSTPIEQGDFNEALSTGTNFSRSRTALSQDAWGFGCFSIYTADTTETAVTGTIRAQGHGTLNGVTSAVLDIGPSSPGSITLESSVPASQSWAGWVITLKASESFMAQAMLL